MFIDINNILNKLLIFIPLPVSEWNLNGIRGRVT